MASRVGIIGSCVTRDIWNLEGFTEQARETLCFVGRNSIASLFARSGPAFEAPATPHPELSPWELRMVQYDLEKKSVDMLAAFRPTHLIIDLIDERFDLLTKGDVVLTHSWELQLTGMAEGSLKGLKRVSRPTDEARALWRAGVDALAAFVRESLPQTRVILHDARWALEYLDRTGERRPFDIDGWIFPGVPANIHQHNAILADSIAYLRQAFPAAFLVRAPPELVVGDEAHRWGPSPFHYTDAYYRHVWARLRELGCGAAGTAT